MSEVQRGYSEAADRYIELIGAISSVHPDDRSLIERHLSTLPGSVLDAGCGPGHFTGHLASLGVQVSGIDIVPEFIAHASRTHPSCTFELASMDQLDHPDGSLDGILAWYSLIHLAPSQLDAVLTELRRVLAVGGILVVGLFDNPTAGEATPFDHQVVTAYRWPIDTFADRLARAGFDEVERQQRPGADVAGQRPHAALAMQAR